MKTERSVSGTAAHFGALPSLISRRQRAMSRTGSTSVGAVAVHSRAGLADRRALVEGLGQRNAACHGTPRSSSSETSV